MPIVSSAQLTVTDIKDALVYSINASAPVITKQAHDASTSGAYSSITVRGKKHLGNIISNYGFLTVTANGSAEASTATDTSSGAVTIAPAVNSGVSSYTVNMYDQATVASATLLDSAVIQVVFKGNGALSAVLSNESHVFPSATDGTVQSYVDSGTSVRVYEGAVELAFVIGTPIAGQWSLATAVTNIVSGAITDSGTSATVAAHSGVSAGVDTASITYTISGVSSTGVSFSLTRAQTFSKSKTGATGAAGSTGTTGASGSSAVTVILSNEAHVLPAATDGTVSSYTGSPTSIRVYEGATLLGYDGVGTTAGKWTISSSATNVASPTFTNNATYATTSIASGVAAGTDTASIDFTISGRTAASTPFTIVKTQTFSKSKAGATGSTGAAAVAYWLSTSAPAIKTNANGAYTPSSVTYYIKSATGSATPVAYSGRFTIEVSSDGVTFSSPAAYTSSVDQSQYAYSIPANVKAVRVRAYLAGGTSTILDEMITTVITDGASVLLSPVAPTFTSSDRVIDAGQSIVFSIVAASIAPTSYAWSFSGLESNPTVTNQSTVTITSTHFGRSNSATVSCMINGDTSLVATRTITRNEAHSVAVGAWYANSLVLKNPADSSNLGIAMDTNSHKRITWNDGDGNWNFRAGNYRDTVAGITKYIKGTNDANSGAAVLTATMDGLDGMWKMRVAPIGTPDTAVTWGSTFTVAVGYINNNADVIYLKNKADTAMYGKFDATGLTVRNGAFFQDSNSVTVAVMGPDGDLWKGSADNTGSKYLTTADLAVTQSISGAWTYTNSLSFSKTSTGSAVTGLSLSNPADTAGTEVRIDMAPNSAGPGIRSAQIAAVNILSSNRTSLVFRTADGNSNPSDVLTLGWDKSATFAGTITGNGSGITNVNAATVAGLSVSNLVYGNTASGQTGASTTWSSADSTQWRSGFWDVNSASWTPDTGWWWGITMSHRNNTGSYNYSGQIAVSNNMGDMQFRNIANGIAGGWKKVLHSGNMGTGNGLDADMVDGRHVGTSGATIPVLNAANTWAGIQDFSGANVALPYAANFSASAAAGLGGRMRLTKGPGSLGASSGGDAVIDFISSGTASDRVRIWDVSRNLGVYIDFSDCGGMNTTQLWHSGNMGSGKGLDSDLLDGQHGSYYTNAANLTGTLNAARLPDSYLPLSGGILAGNLYVSTLGNAGLEIGRTDGVASTPYIDFRCSAAPDYDARIMSRNGTGTTGQGVLEFTAGSFSFVTGAISGNGSGLTSLNATNLSYGSVPATQLTNAVIKSGTYSKSIGDPTGGSVPNKDTSNHLAVIINGATYYLKLYQ